MRIVRFAVENFRSFVDRQELCLDGPMSIIIGPNGGGKTNLLDGVAITLRRFLYGTLYPAHAPTAERSLRYEFRHNDALNQLTLEKNSSHRAQPQVIEIELEVTAVDVRNVASIRSDTPEIIRLSKDKYFNIPFSDLQNWDLSQLVEGQRFVFRIVDESLQYDTTPGALVFVEYLRTFDVHQLLREEYGFSPLSIPLLYLPVTRTSAGFSSGVVLSSFNEGEMKRQVHATSSRAQTGVTALAVGRLAQRYRLLLEQDSGQARDQFRCDPDVERLTKELQKLGYDWELKCTNPLTNQYDVELKKQNSKFLVSAASSGEKEVLTYLFAVFALGVRDALILVDEPELHLHPKWQRSLLRLFADLKEATGNQFLFATHSATFVSPESIAYVSRVYSKEQRSRIFQLDASKLPNARHLLSVVNSQNNEKLFFADHVLLVEGISDRLVFERLFERLGKSVASTLEVLQVGGKGLFATYCKLLDAFQIPWSVVADLDYVEQIGTPELKGLFTVNTKEIKSDVLDNGKSFDGASLVTAIENALTSGSWDHAREIWDYIKARRRILEADIEDPRLRSFLQEQRTRGIFVLRLGSLERYLPAGHASKDLDKLIGLLGEANWWELLPGSKSELAEIAETIVARL